MITGYKNFKSDLSTAPTDRIKFQYEIGKRYKIHENDLKMCNSGFHFHKSIQDIFYYKRCNLKNRICLVKVYGKIIDGKNKSVTNDILIEKEIDLWNDVLSKLKKLYLDYNKLPSLPDSIGNLIQLKKLYLYNNNLFSLPDSIRGLIQLEDLYLYGNKLSIKEQQKIKELLPNTEIYGLDEQKYN